MQERNGLRKGQLRKRVRKLNSAEFQSLALKTEASVSPEVFERFEDVAGRVTFLLRQVSDIAAEADKLKKFVFYGKGHGYSTDLEEEPAVFLRMEEDLRIVHGLLGLVSEIGELIDVHEAYWDGHVGAIDVVNVVEEIGDLGWYSAVMCSTAGSDLGVAYSAVIDKLSERYPDKFSERDALERNVESERRILESRIDGNGLF